MTKHQLAAPSGDCGLNAAPTPRGRVAMFHVGRSGSTVLGNLLDQHSRISWQSEVVFKHYSQFPQGMSKDAPQADPLQLMLASMAGINADFYGFEAKFFHLDRMGVSLAEFLTMLDDLGFAYYIVLERKNLLRKIVSSLIAKQRGAYNRRVGHRAELTRIVIDIHHVRIDGDDNSLVAFLENYHNQMRELKRRLAGRDVLCLTYEDDILNDPLVAYRRVSKYLGVVPEPVRINLGRINPYPLREIVENFDEVAQALKETPFEWMLEPGQ